MLAKFKENYTIQIWEDDNVQSGQFTFVKGKGYQCEYKKNKLNVYDFDMAVHAMFNNKQVEKYLNIV